MNALRRAGIWLARISWVIALAGRLVFAPQPAIASDVVLAETVPQEQAGPEEQADQAVPPPVKEKAVSGTIDFGYRWVPRLAGNEHVYRSIVNLGEGPKLFGTNLSFRSPRPHLFDRLDLQANSWGGEPYSTLRLDASREGVWALGLHYRSLDYFNMLPSFANPLLGLGSELSQNGRDMKRRLFDAQLDVFPNRRVAPFFHYSRTAGTGPGLTTFVGTGNEYLVNTRFDDAVDLFRGGTRLNFSRLNLTLEAGGSRFRDDQRVFYDAGPNPGNRRTPLLGQTTRLDQGEQNYRAEGSSFFTRAAFQLQPSSWLDLSGQFSFTQPSLDFAFTEALTGNFVRAPSLVAFTDSRSSAVAEALRPHPSGNLTVGGAPGVPSAHRPILVHGPLPHLFQQLSPAEPCRGDRVAWHGTAGGPRIERGRLCHPHQRLRSLPD